MSVKRYYSVAVSVLAGLAVGAGAVQVLHAEDKAPVYVVSEADVMDVAPFQQEYTPAAEKALTDAGGKYIVRNGKSLSLYGDPPKRITVVEFSDMKQAIAAFNSAAYRDAKKAGDRNANFRIYAIEGMPQ